MPSLLLGGSLARFFFLTGSLSGSRRVTGSSASLLKSRAKCQSLCSIFISPKAASSAVSSPDTDEVGSLTSFLHREQTKKSFFVTSFSSWSVLSSSLGRFVPRNPAMLCCPDSAVSIPVNANCTLVTFIVVALPTKSFQSLSPAAAITSTLKSRLKGKAACLDLDAS